jgi:hypothetical protein
VPGLVGGDFREGYFPIPDPLYCRANGYEFVKNRSKASFVPWEQRIPKVVWRGTCSGDLSRGDWRSLQRVRLCEIGSTSELFDVGLGDYLVGHDERTVAEIKGSGLMRPRLPSFLRYKYQIDVPGNGNSPSWSGLINKLAMGSALLQVASWSVGFKLSYSDRLKPWFHFVPVAADLSDLVEKAEWLKNHDEQARQIGLQGQELAYSLEYETELQLAFKTVQAAIAHHSYAFRE